MTTQGDLVLLGPDWVYIITCIIPQMERAGYGIYVDYSRHFIADSGKIKEWCHTVGGSLN